MSIKTCTSRSESHVRPGRINVALVFPRRRWGALTHTLPLSATAITCIIVSVSQRQEPNERVAPLPPLHPSILPLPLQWWLRGGAVLFPFLIVRLDRCLESHQ